MQDPPGTQTEVSQFQQRQFEAFLLVRRLCHAVQSS
jgi:hypothetical protein